MRKNRPFFLSFVAQAAAVVVGQLLLLYFFIYAPNDLKRIASIRFSNQPTLLHGLYGTAVGGWRPKNLVIPQTTQHRVTAERIGFKLVAMLHVPEQVLFVSRQFRRCF
ncbi:MAG: hypothetical protein ACM34E_11945 [Acidobacteriota bacterium]